MKTFFLFPLILALAACQKRVEYVDDPPVPFNVVFKSGEVNTEGVPQIKLKRGDPSSFERVQIQTDPSDQITKVEKSIVCGPLSSQGPTVAAPQDDLLEIRVGAVDFPGLDEYPKEIKCELIVKLTNQRGSTTTGKFLLELFFDKVPPIRVATEIMEMGLYTGKPGDLVPFEVISLTNTLSYPIHVVLDPRALRRCRQAYLFKKRTASPYSGACYAEGGSNSGCKIESIVLVRQGLQIDIPVELRLTVEVAPQETIFFKTFTKILGPLNPDPVFAYHTQRHFELAGYGGHFNWEYNLQSEIQMFNGFQGADLNKTPEAFSPLITEFKGTLRRNNDINTNLPGVGCNY